MRFVFVIVINEIRVRFCSLYLFERFVRFVFVKSILLRVEVGGFAFVFGGALFEEGPDALKVVGALVDPGAVGVDALEALRRQRRRGLAQDAELPLDGADGHDAVATQGIQEVVLQDGVQLLGLRDAVDKTHIQGVVGRDGRGEEEHLAGLVDAQLVDEVHDAGGVIRDAYLGRGDGEGGVVGADDHVAREAQVAGTAPHTAVDAGDDGDGRLLDAAQEFLHGDVVGQGVFAVLRQLTDVVAGAPDAFTALGLDDDADTFLGVAVVDGGLKFLTHGLAEAVEVVGVLHLDVADPIVDNSID